uniref:MATH domain-containing protein n=1 Tax=Clytia hemisphaerica TaxID=252671 RepID=A0A7M5X595_9CNID
MKNRKRKMTLVTSSQNVFIPQEVTNLKLHNEGNELFPNGNGPRRNKNMAICARTVQGSFDDTINWPMKAMIEFYALDRSGNRRSYISFNTNQTADVTESFVKPPHTENGRGIDHFVSLSNGNPYPNDTFTVEVMINYKEN